MTIFHTPSIFKFRFRIALLALALVAAIARGETSVLYDKPSQYGHIVVTQEAEGLRTLRFERGGARQSVVKPDDPGHIELSYARAALIGLALQEDPRRVLVVGLGGGTLPRFLHAYYPAASIDAVDIDPDVVQVAKDYFGFREDARLRAHVADGRRFIEQVRTPYDLIFLDAYGASSVPAHMTTEEFLRTVRRALSSTGVLVGNLWSGDHNNLYAAMARTYEQVFETVKILPAGGNRIVLALPRQDALEHETLVRRARRVSASKRFQFDLGVMVAEQSEREREAIRKARVLRD
ncbi:MAG: spermidine synthase [Rhodospirillaceae bacterium]